MLPSDDNRFDQVALEQLSEQLKVGIAVSSLAAQLEQCFRAERAQSDIQSYRERSRPWKKLSDEISPVSRYLEAAGIASGTVRFPQDDAPFDAWLTPEAGTVEIGIEVTVAGARQRITLHKYNRGNRLYRANLALPDDSHEHQYEIAATERRILGTRKGLVDNVKSQISTALAKKAGKSGYGSGVLVIDAALSPITDPDPWPSMAEALKSEAANAPFDTVVVIGTGVHARLLTLKP